MDFDRAQRLIDEEVLDYESRILKLKNCRNTLTHISRIPNEVLVDIFAISKKNVSNIRQWHQFTHVCRHWRSVALAAASLWTAPPTHLHDDAIAMLERSRECALDIHLDYRTSTSTTAATLSYVGRMQSLSIVQCNEALNSFQDALLSAGSEASQLKKLRISHRTYLEEQPTPGFKLLASTFSPRAPLKALDLNGIDLEWQIFPIQNLTSLSLVFLELSNPPSWSQFLETLRGMPLLEFMSFSFDTLKLTSQPSWHLGPVQMPHLRHIDIHWSTASDIHTFLCHTTYPRLRAAYFECSSSHGLDPHDYTAASHAVTSLATRCEFGPLNQLIVGDDRFLMLKKGGKWTERRELEFWCPSRLTDPPSTRLARDAMSAISSLSNSLASDVLHLIILEDYTGEELVEFFSQLSHLEFIQAKTSSRAVIESIAVNKTQANRPGLSTWFPNLRKISLQNNDYTPELFEDLCICLSARQKCGLGIRQLSVNWDLTSDEAGRLQEIVGDLKWKTSADSDED